MTTGIKPHFSFVDKKLNSDLNFLIERFIKKCSSLNKKSSFLTSRITECDVKLLKQALNLSLFPDSPSHLNKYHFKWHDCFALGSENIRLLDSDFKVCDWNYSLEGTIDYLVSINDATYCVMVKQEDDNKIEEIEREGGKRKDVVEIMSNMWLAEIKNSLLIYSGNSRHCFISIEANSRVLNAVRDKCTSLCNYKMLGKMPEKPYKTESSECLCCSFKKECWNGN